MKQTIPDKWKIQIEHSTNTKPKIEVKPWGILITVPEKTTEEEVCSIIRKHRMWIKKKYSEILEAIELSKNIELENRDIEQLRKKAEEILAKATTEILGINPCKLVVRKMKTRWASCSPSGTITLNSITRHLPDNLLAYIIYHEVCHIIAPKHNYMFHQCITKYYPNYRGLEKLLLAYEIKLGLM